jgi:hypothetical protein
MNKGNHGPTTWSILSLGIACALLALAFLPLLTPAALAELPPRPPTPTFTPQPKASPTPRPVTPQREREEEGGTIELDARFDPSWPWESVHWQEPWTVVQWQDEWGYWRDVETWQGALDSVAIGEDGTVTGKKTWGVAQADLGKGPFRWVVLRRRGSWRLATSELFYLPARPGDVTQVDVTLSLWGGY